MANSAEGIRWNLNDLFTAADDPQIETTLADCRTRAEAFAKRVRPLMQNPQTLGAEDLLRALADLEIIYEALGRVGSYAGLLYAADTANPVHQDLEQKVEQRSTEVRNLLLFFELEWLKFDDQTADRLLGKERLKSYAHYLRNLRRYRPHTLTEREEKVVNEKNNTGPNAFGRLFSEITSALLFTLNIDGNQEPRNLSQMLSLLHDPDRALRQRAMDTLYRGLSEHGQVLSFIYDTLIQDHLTMDRLRLYSDPMAQRHLSNEIDPGAVKIMMEVTEEHYGLAQDYFRLKAKLLGLPRIALYDQYAPLGKEARPFRYAQARELILEAFESFDPCFRQLAAEFFAKNWIDAEMRNGKRGGAFCASPSPKLHPYILCNYDDHLRDAMTLSHELGHGLHGCLSRKQNYFNYDTPLTTAETASIFGEMLVFDHLLPTVSDRQAQLALSAARIEDVLATVFRQNVLTRFEELAFAARQDRRLTAEALGNLWLDVNRKYYGEAVEIVDGYRWGWSYIPHFIHSRFYCYSYVFGQLLVLALYRMYKEQGKSFVPKYLALLEAGGSDSPQALLRPLGVDIHEREFWRKGFEEIAAMLATLQSLI
ncbi:MAG TPA: M3 family oligoendopeptidase [Candidatus Binatia bacterium]|nr:M3 family oligoendopeptidase [Candidatus Binatia bacterium]